MSVGETYPLPVPDLLSSESPSSEIVDGCRGTDMERRVEPDEAGLRRGEGRTGVRVDAAPGALAAAAACALRELLIDRLAGDEETDEDAPGVSSIDGGGLLVLGLCPAEIAAATPPPRSFEGVPGILTPLASRSMLPLSLPYAGGGAKVPTLGARPHFFTLASM